MLLEDLGAGCFGLVIGWLCYRTIRRKEDRTALRDLSAVIGIIGGGGVIALFGVKGPLFGSYAIGLAAGFFGYLTFWTFVETSDEAPQPTVKTEVPHEGGAGPVAEAPPESKPLPVTGGGGHHHRKLGRMRHEVYRTAPKRFNPLTGDLEDDDPLDPLP